MNQDQMNSGDDKMLDEYDFSNGTRGKYVKRFKAGSNVIILDPDVAEIFPDSESVNNALRGIAYIIRNEMKRHDASPSQPATTTADS